MRTVCLHLPHSLGLPQVGEVTEMSVSGMEENDQCRAKCPAPAAGRSQDKLESGLVVTSKVHLRHQGTMILQKNVLGTLMTCSDALA